MQLINLGTCKPAEESGCSKQTSRVPTCSVFFKDSGEIIRKLGTEESYLFLFLFISTL